MISCLVNIVYYFKMEESEGDSVRYQCFHGGSLSNALPTYDEATTNYESQDLHHYNNDQENALQSDSENQLLFNGDDMTTTAFIVTTTYRCQCTLVVI